MPANQPAYTSAADKLPSTAANSPPPSNRGERAISSYLDSYIAPITITKTYALYTYFYKYFQIIFSNSSCCCNKITVNISEKTIYNCIYVKYFRSFYISQ